LQHHTEYQMNFTMGFRRLINSKKILSLFALFLTLGTNVLMAQTTASAATATGTASTTAVDDKSAMWLGVGYYVLLFLILCVAVVIVGKILKVYDLTLQMQNKKGMDWNKFMAIAFIVFLILVIVNISSILTPCLDEASGKV